MSTPVWIAVFSILVLSALAIAVWLLWRVATPDERALVRRIGRLPLRGKLRLAWAVLRDRRIPLVLRAVAPALVLYLSMPLDVVPDFIPVLGQLDDVVIILVGVGLLLRLTPRDVVEGHVAALEAATAA